MTANYNIERVENNLKALTELQSKHPNADILKKYSGWGGLRNAIFTPEIYRVLKKHLSDEQISSIKKTTTNAYYTPGRIIEFIYEALKLLDKPFETILEPSAGHGAFLELMPASLKEKAKLYAIEIDEISRRLLKQLYPGVMLVKGGFEDNHPAMKFDLIVGNPPYGREVLQDKHHEDLSNLRIHHYFVAKSMRLLKPGGVLAMVLPRFFMDNRRDHAREIIANDNARLLAAYRLPDNLFVDAKVMVDVVFLVKETGDKSWIHTDKIIVDNEALYINRYFSQNPSHVFGQLCAVEAYGRPELTCKAKDGEDIFQQLFKQLEFFPPEQMPSMEEYKVLIAKRKRAIDVEMQSLTQFKHQLMEAEKNIQMMERQVLKDCSSKFNLANLL